MNRLRQLLTRPIFRLACATLVLVAAVWFLIIAPQTGQDPHNNAKSIPASEAASIVKSGQARSIEVQLDKAYVGTDDALYVPAFLRRKDS